MAVPYFSDRRRSQPFRYATPSTKNRIVLSRNKMSLMIFPSAT